MFDGVLCGVGVQQTINGANPRAGRYALKFDLVSEGVDWFERCGSATTTVPFTVR